MDGARDAVVKLGIQLGQLVAGEKSKVKLASILVLLNRFLRYYPSDLMCDIRCQENESMNTSRFSQKRYLSMGWNRPGVDAGLRDVPDSSSLHDVPDHELADRLKRKMWEVENHSSPIPTLSLGTALEQLVQRTYLTWPLPCLLRPWFLLFEVIFWKKG